MLDRWEYMMLNPVVPMAEFSDLGRRGWELCGFDHNGSAWLKRNTIKRDLAQQAGGFVRFGSSGRG